MSSEAVGWVYRHSPYRGTVFAVHLAMADSVNDQHENEFWMKQSVLASKARVGRTAANIALTRLTQDGFVQQLEEGGGRSRPARFRFLFPPAPAIYESRKVSSEQTLTPPETVVSKTVVRTETVQPATETVHSATKTVQPGNTHRTQKNPKEPKGPTLSQKSLVQTLVGFFTEECDRQGFGALKARKGLIASKVQGLVKQELATEDEIREGIVRVVAARRPEILENLVADIQGGFSNTGEEDLRPAYDFCLQYADRTVVEEEEGRMRANGVVPKRKMLIDSVRSRMLKVGVRMPGAPEPSQPKRTTRGGNDPVPVSSLLKVG